MTEGQWAAVIWGPLATVLGLVFFFGRDVVSRAAREHRAKRGGYVGPHTQSPTIIAVTGVIGIVAGVTVFVLGLTGVLR